MSAQATLNGPPLRGRYGTITDGNSLRIVAKDEAGTVLGEVLIPEYPLSSYSTSGQVRWNPIQPGLLQVESELLPVHTSTFLDSPLEARTGALTLSGRGSQFGAKKLLSSIPFSAALETSVHPIDERCKVETEAFVKLEITHPNESAEITEGWTYSIVKPDRGFPRGVLPCSTSLMNLRETYLAGDAEEQFGLGIFAVADKQGFISTPAMLWVTDPVTENEYRKIHQVRVEYRRLIQSVR